MKIFGIAGWSGSGKTTLVLKLIVEFNRRGVRVATIKHTHHNPALGDDEMRAMLEGGAVEAAAASPQRFGMIHELRDCAEPDLSELTGIVRNMDLLLVEGFKFSSHLKLEVWNPDLGKAMLAPDDANVVALACDIPVPGLDRPCFHRNDVHAICDFIQGFLQC